MESGGVCMWTSETMTLGEAAIYSITAIAVVFLALVSIALFVKIISAVVGAVVKEESVTKPTAVQSKPVEPKQDLSLVAAVIAAVSEETKLSVDKFKIVSIEEKK